MTDAPVTPKRAAAIRAGLRGAGSLALAGLVANAAGVIVTVIIARMLTTRSYGAIILLVSIFMVLAMPGYAVLVAVVRAVSHWETTGRAERVGPWIRRWRTVAWVCVAIVAVLSVLVGPQFASLLRLPDASGVAPILVAGAIWVPLSMDRGLIQARRAYGPMARNLIVEGGVRTVGTIVLVALGLGVQGAMIAILASAVLADLDARATLGRLAHLHAAGAEPGGAGHMAAPATEPGVSHDRLSLRSAPVESSADIAEEIAIATAGEAPVSELPESLVGSSSTDLVHRAAVDLAAAFFALALLAALESLDVIVLGKLAPHSSGPYGAVSVVSKVLFFGAMVLSGYLLPEATTRWHRGEHALHQLAVALGILAIPAFLEEGIAVVASRPVLDIGFSHKYAAAAPALPYLVAAMACLAVSVMLTYYLLGAGRHYVVWILTAAAILLAVLEVRAHGSLAGTARADLVAQGALVVVLAGILAGFTRRHHGRVSTESG